MIIIIDSSGKRYKRPDPKFNFKLPKNGVYDSAKRLAQEYNLICEKYMDFEGEKIGLWEKVSIE